MKDLAQRAHLLRHAIIAAVAGLSVILTTSGAEDADELTRDITNATLFEGIVDREASTTRRVLFVSGGSITIAVREIPPPGRCLTFEEARERSLSENSELYARLARGPQVH